MHTKVVINMVAFEFSTTFLGINTTKKSYVELKIIKKNFNLGEIQLSKNYLNANCIRPKKCN